PDGDGAFEFPYGPLARFEGGASMRGADGDHDAGLADFHPPRAMHDANVRDVELLVCLLTQPLHLRHGHRFVGFINEVQRATTFCPFTSIAVEGDGRATLWQYHPARDRADIEGLSG